ncbi:prepilin peptidase [Agromyces atrinae]|uniref:prepilin peptidase n=1 Tax=Agromyces atrinae TaxID=592376 RepID=UPI001F56E32C|nr:prepilin peptidase [Agromyces atrinae]MCI2957308.1 prepilin peptidase [Agromyces atrinae]
MNSIPTIRAVVRAPGAAARTTLRVVVVLCGVAALIGLVARLGDDRALPVVVLLAVVAVPLAIVDLEEHRLPNHLVLPTTLVAATLLAAAAVATDAFDVLVRALLGGAVMFGLYLAGALASPRSVGMGDVKLAALLGLVLGWFGWSTWVAGLALAIVIGGVVAVLAVLLRRATLSSALPFGPSMLAGALAAVILIA